MGILHVEYKEEKWHGYEEEPVNPNVVLADPRFGFRHGQHTWNEADKFITSWWKPKVSINDGIKKVFEEMKNDRI